jgi:hypothetical protein
VKVIVVILGLGGGRIEDSGLGEVGLGELEVREVDALVALRLSSRGGVFGVGGRSQAGDGEGGAQHRGTKRLTRRHAGQEYVRTLKEI